VAVFLSIRQWSGAFGRQIALAIGRCRNIGAASLISASQNMLSGDLLPATRWGRLAFHQIAEKS